VREVDVADTEEALDAVASPDVLKAVIELAPTAMLMSDRHGRIVLVNAETEKLFGYERADLIGSSVDRLVPERLRSLHPAHRTGFFVDPTSRPMGAGRDLYALRRDGSEFPVEIGLNPIRTGSDVFVLASIVDISERKRMESRF